MIGYPGRHLLPLQALQQSPAEACISGRHPLGSLAQLRAVVGGSTFAFMKVARFQSWQHNWSLAVPTLLAVLCPRHWLCSEHCSFLAFLTYSLICLLILLLGSHSHKEVAHTLTRRWLTLSQGSRTSSARASRVSESPSSCLAWPMHSIDLHTAQ